MAGITKKEREEREQAFNAELRYLGALHKEYRKKIDDAQAELDNIRNDIEILMRKNNKDSAKLPDLLLSFSVKEASPSRRFDYDGLKAANESLYHSLERSGIIKVIPPTKKYRLEIRGLKPTKKQIAEWEAGV